MEFGSSSVADKLFPIATNFETVSKAPGSVVRAQAPLPVSDPRYILNHMVQYSEPVLDASFAALSDATRRGVLEQLGRAHASITDLAEKFHMTLTGMKKHVGVLERAGLVTTKKVGRVRTCKLGLRGLEKAHDSNFPRPGPCRHSVLGPNPNCSSAGGYPNRVERPSFPARPMFVREARTVSCSVTPPRSSLCHFSVGTSK